MGREKVRTLWLQALSDLCARCKRRAFRQEGTAPDGTGASFYHEFARITAQIEREECAKLCDRVAQDIEDVNGTASYCAAAIRARGDA